MNNEAHARTLLAYLNRLTMDQRERLNDALYQTEYAAMQLGMNAQIKAMDDLKGTALEVIGEISEWDRNNIAAIVTSDQR